MLKTRTLIALILVLSLLLGGLAYFYFFYIRTPVQKAQVEGITHLFSIYGWGTSEDELLNEPRGVAADDNGNIYVTVTPKGLVAVFDNEGNFLFKFGEYGVNPGNLRGPIGISINSKENRVYVADRVRFRLVIYNLKGKFINEVPVLSPVTPLATKDGRVFLATFGPIVVFDKDGNKLTSFGTRGLLPGQFDYPHGLAMDSQGYLYVSDTNNTRLQVLDTSMTVVGVKGAPPSSLLETTREFGLPAGLAIDEKDRLYVVDSFDFSIKVYTNTGKFLAKYGGEGGTLEGQFRYPDGICYMGNRTFAIADTGNDRVQVIRITLPGEGGITERIPWWIWLFLVPPIIWLLTLFGRRKYYADDEFLARVVEDENLSLLASVAPVVFVPEELLEKYGDYEEEDIRGEDVLRDRGYSDKVLDDIRENFEELSELEAKVLAVARKRWYEKLFLQRPLVFADSERVKEAARQLKLKIMDYEEFLERYQLEEEEEA